MNGPGDVIAPDTSVSYVASGATSEATFEGLGDVRVLQSYTGASSSDADNIFDYETGSDIRISFSGAGLNASGTGQEIVNNAWTSSADSSLRIASDGSSDIVMANDSVLNDDDAGTFNGALGAVAAAAFTMPGGRWNSSDAVSVEFKDDDDNVLATQAFAAGDLTGCVPYFGFQSTRSNIGLIEVTLTVHADPFAVDDFATSMTSVPEPASMALLGLGGLCLLGRRRAASVNR